MSMSRSAAANDSRHVDTHLRDERTVLRHVTQLRQGSAAGKRVTLIVFSSRDWQTRDPQSCHVVATEGGQYIPDWFQLVSLLQKR